MAKDEKVDMIEELIEELDEKIEAINSHKVVRAAEALIQKRDRMMAARRALLGAGNKMTGGAGGSRVTQAEVVAWFERNEGAHTVETIAGDMSHSPEVVRGHLNRGKGERFIKLDDNRWILRDPKNGINTADDWEDEE